MDRSWREWIEDGLRKGYTYDQLRQVLADDNHNSSIIDQYISEVQSTKEKSRKRPVLISMAVILGLVIGLYLVISSGIVGEFGSSGIGSAPVSAQPASYPGPYKQEVAVLEVEDKSSIDYKDLAKEFYRSHDDEYDFISFIHAFPDTPGQASQYHVGIRNNVEGIGRRIHDDTNEWGSDGRLLGMSTLGGIDKYLENPDGPYNAMFEEIIGHQWGVFVGEVDGHWLEDRVTPSHWSGCVNHYKSDPYVDYWKAGSWVPEGSGWKKDIRSELEDREETQRFDPFMLYLMGFLPPEDVPDMKYIVPDDPSREDAGCRVDINDPSTYVVYETEEGDKSYIGYVEGEMVDVSVYDIIDQYGPRSPSYGDAQKEFSVAYILLVEEGSQPSDESIEALERWAEEFPNKLKEATSQ